MAIEDRVTFGIEWPTLTDLKRGGSRLLRGVILTVAAIAWVVFWSVVIRLHVQQGDIVSAGVVSTLFVLPAIIAYGLYLRLKRPRI